MSEPYIGMVNLPEDADLAADIVRRQDGRRCGYDFAYHCARDLVCMVVADCDGYFMR